ncbi:MAG: PadR family transcriptional regulator [Coprobacillaceae bacterium]
MTSDMLRGHTEAIILAHLIEHDSYGYQINKDILNKTNNQYELKEATLYSAFRRLEQEGKIKSYWGNEESNARRRYYAITDIGKQAYERQKDEWELTKSIIDTLIK